MIMPLKSSLSLHIRGKLLAGGRLLARLLSTPLVSAPFVLAQYVSAQYVSAPFVLIPFVLIPFILTQFVLASFVLTPMACAEEGKVLHGSAEQSVIQPPADLEPVQQKPAVAPVQPRPAGAVVQPKPVGALVQPKPAGAAVQPKPAGVSKLEEARQRFLEDRLRARENAEKNRSLRGSVREQGRPRLPPPRAGATDYLSAELRKGPAHASFQLSAVDERRLKNADVYIILDHSGSMNGNDCPSGNDDRQRRLEWSIEELSGFTKALEQALPHGFTFIPFNRTPEAFEVRSAEQFNTLLGAMTASGGTSLTPALELAFQRHQSHLNQPMLVAVISDGQIGPTDDVSGAIASATKRFTLPNGVFITFMQVGIMAEHNTNLAGNRPGTRRRFGLDRLTSMKQTDGCAYEPCLVVPFSQLRNDGLGRTLLQGLRRYVPD